MKFRKKPVVVDAVQWWPPGHSQHVALDLDTQRFWNMTPGCWVVTRADGSSECVEHARFVQEYEEVREPVELSGNTGQLASMPERVPADLEDDAMPQ